MSVSKIAVHPNIKPVSPAIRNSVLLSASARSPIRSTIVPALV